MNSDATITAHLSVAPKEKSMVNKTSLVSLEFFFCQQYP